MKVVFLFVLFNIIGLYAQIVPTQESLNNLMGSSSGSGLSADQIANLMESKNSVSQKTYNVDTEAKSENKVNKKKNLSISYDDRFDSLYRLSIYKRFYERDSLKKKIKIFGEQFFIFAPDMFKPINNMPIPNNYIFGAGDIIELSFWGDIQTQYESKIRKDGNILLPHVGKVFVSGLSYTLLKNKLLKRYSKVFSTLAYGKKGARTFMDINLSKMRSINVYVLGEAMNPGVYTLNGLSNIYAGIYFSGGPAKNGSFRDIKVIRNNKIISTIDLYDFLINGKMDKNFRLQDGDIILYKRIKNLVTVFGAVNRPLKYELKDNEALKDLLKYAGGVNNSAYIKYISLSRILPFDKRTSNETTEELTLKFNNLKELNSSDVTMRNGDIIRINSIYNQNTNKVYIGGAFVRHGGYFGLNKKLQTLSDLIKQAGGLKPQKFNKVTLYHKLPNNLYTVKTLDLEKDKDFVLSPFDSIKTYSAIKMKDYGNISVRGLVNQPGDFVFNPGMKLSDAILIANGFKYNVDTNYIELIRVDTLSDNVYTKIFKVKMNKKFEILSGVDYVLKSRDAISVHGNPNIVEKKAVKVTGFIKYPGTYYLLNDKEEISDIIGRAGGARADGNLHGAILFRHGSKVNIDLYRAYKKRKSVDNIKLMSGDSIYVPTLDQTVHVYGEVMFDSKVVWRPGKGANYYINQVGGLSENADKKRIGAFLANGKRAKIRSCWFDDKLDAGSYIYVPKKQKKTSYFIETLKISRETIGVFSSLAALVVSYYTIKAIKEK